MAQATLAALVTKHRLNNEGMHSSDLDNKIKDALDTICIISKIFCQTSTPWGKIYHTHQLSWLFIM